MSDEKFSDLMRFLTVAFLVIEIVALAYLARK
jgi:hypothetical protein